MTPTQRKEKIEAYGRAYDQLKEALKGFPRQMWPYKPGPDRWSIQEIILHIADSEANSYVRCRCFLAEPGKTIMAYDENRWAVGLQYHRQNPDAAVELFGLLRQMSFRLIASLPEQAWSNEVIHPESGRMTLEDWLTIYTNHIPEHIGQMQATYDAWVAHQQGRQPDSEKTLFRPLE